MEWLIIPKQGIMVRTVHYRHTVFGTCQHVFVYSMYGKFLNDRLQFKLIVTAKYVEGKNDGRVYVSRFGES